MKISVVRVETKNLRCPDTSINLKDRKTGAVINLIQMPNGTGKTTIIELLQGILTGEARNWSADKIGSYKAKDDTVYNGEFDLTISIQRDNEHNQEVVFRAEFDFVHGSVEFFTKKDVHHGQERGWAPPKDLKQYITSSC